MHEIPPPQADFSAPPPYEVAANSKLPTYEEVQREKQMEGEDLPQVFNQVFINKQKKKISKSIYPFSVINADTSIKLHGFLECWKTENLITSLAMGVPSFWPREGQVSSRGGKKNF